MNTNISTFCSHDTTGVYNILKYLLEVSYT